MDLTALFGGESSPATTAFSNPFREEAKVVQGSTLRRAHLDFSPFQALPEPLLEVGREIMEGEH